MTYRPELDPWIVASEIRRLRYEVDQLNAAVAKLSEREYRRSEDLYQAIAAVAREQKT